MELKKTFHGPKKTWYFRGLFPKKTALQFDFPACGGYALANPMDYSYNNRHENNRRNP